MTGWLWTGRKWKPVTVLGPSLVTVIVYVVCVPATSDVTLFVLTIVKSTVGTSGSVSVDELFAWFDSVTPVGGVTVAVLEIISLATPLFTVAETTKLVEPPAGINPLTKVTVPPLWVAPPVAETNPKFAGNGSVTVAPVTSLGPLFVTTIV